MSVPKMMAELRDGTHVPLDTFNSVCQAAESLVVNKELYTLHCLVKKCQDANFKFAQYGSGDPETTLKQYNLINENGDVHEDIRKIVLNSIEENEKSLIIFVPIQGEVCKVKITRV